MKRWLCIALTLFLTMSMVACGGKEGAAQGTEGTATLQVGFGRESIMPDGPVHLSGGDPEKRISTHALDELKITCVALQEGDQTYLLYTMDTGHSRKSFTDATKTAIFRTTNIPKENIIMCATHSHAAVSLDTQWDGVEDYLRLFNEAAVYAAKAALSDLVPAQMYHGNVETEGMAFVRHYKLSDGSYAGSNFGNFENGEIVGHAAQADGQFQLVRFTREGKKDVVLMNFPAHATFSSTADTYISADFPGPTRDYIEANSNSLVAYFMAAAGNQGPTSRITEENKFARTQYKEYGAALGKYAVDALPGLTKAESTIMKRSVQSYTGQSNKDKLELMPFAQTVISAGKQYGNVDPRTVAVARENGFSSYYEAQAVINRSSTPATVIFDIQAMTIGPVGFVFAPYEMFNSQGVYIKENSICETTFISTIADDQMGYMPDPFGFQIGCYESLTTRFVAGTGEELAQLFVDMLAQLQG